MNPSNPKKKTSNKPSKKPLKKVSKKTKKAAPALKKVTTKKVVVKKSVKKAPAKIAKTKQIKRAEQTKKAKAVAKPQKGMNIPILYEDKNMIVVNKPAGLVVHPDGKTEEYTLCDWISSNYPKLKGVGEPARLANGTFVDRPGIVHRLDRDTSGVLIVAKNQDAFQFLKDAFQTRAVQKTYNTIVWGFVKEDKGVIDRPIGRSKTDFRKWSAERFARGDLRPAVTEYKVIKRFKTEDLEPLNLNDEAAGHIANQGKKGVTNIPEQFTFLEAYPKTGRTHQIRVHLKAINHPVIGDTLYAPNHPKVLGFRRLALHSRKVAFRTMDKKDIEVEAPLPKDFALISSQISQIPDFY